jgi:hypothetical protein
VRGSYREFAGAGPSARHRSASAASNSSRQLRSSSSNAVGPSRSQHRRDKPSAKDPLTRSPSRRSLVGSKGTWPIMWSSSTNSDSKAKLTVTLAFRAESRQRETTKPGWSFAGTSRLTTVSSGPRAATKSVSMSPHPLTQGASPLSDHPFALGVALNLTGPGRSPPRATPPLISPLTTLDNWARNDGGASGSSTAASSRKC